MNMSFEDAVPLMESLPEFQALEDEGRRAAFLKFIKRQKVSWGAVLFFLLFFFRFLEGFALDGDVFSSTSSSSLRSTLLCSFWVFFGSDVCN